jgi:hypothetical protein
VDLGKNHENTNFLTHLGLEYTGDGGDNEVNRIMGATQSFLEESDFYYTGGTNPHFSVDRLSPSTGASVLYYSDDEIGRIFSIENETYRAISSAVIFSAIKNGDSLNLKPYLISEYFNYLLGIQTTTSLREHLAGILSQAYPNPFNNQVKISYELATEDQVQICIYDLNGKMVRQLINEEQQSGSHSVIWDGTGDSGLSVESGFYFYSLTLDKVSATGKVILIK